MQNPLLKKVEITLMHQKMIVADQVNWKMKIQFKLISEKYPGIIKIEINVLMKTLV